MILGAVSDNPKYPIHGQYKPWEFGKVTVWQLRNLFGFNGAAAPHVDTRTAFWRASRLKGESEFSIWCRWRDDVAPALEKRQ